MLVFLQQDMNVQDLQLLVTVKEWDAVRNCVKCVSLANCTSHQMHVTVLLEQQLQTEGWICGGGPMGS